MTLHVPAAHACSFPPSVLRCTKKAKCHFLLTLLSLPCLTQGDAESASSSSVKPELVPEPVPDSSTSTGVPPVTGADSGGSEVAGVDASGDEPNQNQTKTKPASMPAPTQVNGEAVASPTDPAPAPPTDCE